jgi:hypothetical protein
MIAMGGFRETNDKYIFSEASRKDVNRQAGVHVIAFAY